MKIMSAGSLFLGALFAISAVNAQIAPSIEWQKSLGGSGLDQAYSMQQTIDGGYIIAGLSSSNDGDVTGNHGSYDYWIVKLNTAGTIDWQKTLGGSSDEYALSIQQTTDSGFIVAGYSQSINQDVTGNHGLTDYWIVKLDASGNLVWEKSLGGSNVDIARAIQQTTDGGFIIAGYSQSTDQDVSGNHGLTDYWIVKIGAAGNLVWQKSLGGSGDDRPVSIQQTTDGGFVVAGYSNSNNGDISGNHGGYDYWIVKLDSGGNLAWQNSLGGASDDLASSVQQTIDGGFIVAGYSYSTDGDISENLGLSDYWVVKLDATGNLAWQKSFGGSDIDRAYSIQQTADSGYIVAGGSQSIDGDISGNHGYDDYWVVKTDPSGNIMWDESLGGIGYDETRFIQETNDGGFVMSGYSDSNDGEVTGNHGLDDYWIVKLSCNLSQTFYADADNDGYGDATISIVAAACSPPAGYVLDSTDCNDSSGLIHPGAPEMCNGIDDNCIGGIDEGVVYVTYYLDADTDSYGNGSVSVSSCNGSPAGYVANGTDCNDSNDLIHPGATEICNGIDDNCIGGIDEGVVFVTYYLDADLDTYGNVSFSVSSCNGAPPGYVADNTDCNDSNELIHPGVPEVCNGIDDNCIGGIDDGLAFVTYYLDADVDSYGNVSLSVSSCNGAPAGYVADSTDCNDDNGLIHPGAIEICNGIDDNCINGIDDGLTFVTYYQDADSDDYGNALASVFVCSGIPGGYVTDSTDCNDANPNINPGSQEIPNNGIDDNCNGDIDEFGVGIQQAASVFFWSIFPNPSNGNVTVAITLQHEELLTVKVFDVAGRELYSENEGNISGSFVKQLDLRNFSPGTYWMQIIHNDQRVRSNGDEISRSKFMIEK